jgi:hypothetical protein
MLPRDLVMIWLLSGGIGVGVEGTVVGVGAAGVSVAEAGAAVAVAVALGGGPAEVSALGPNPQAIITAARTARSASEP